MKRRHAGFTLIEVLVALAVLALALGALVGATSSQARNTAYLVERTLAQWVALNTVAEYRLEERWPDPGTRGGDATLGERRWRWQVATTETSDPALRRLDVSVRAADGDAPLVTLAAYVAEPGAATR